MEQLDLEEYIKQHVLLDNIKQLEHERLRIELSDDFAYTNGKLGAINELIREARKKLND